MAGGSISKEKPTDQQCRSCSLWYDSRGIERHESNCDGSRPDDPAGEVETFDPAADREPSEPEEPEMTEPTCPRCESSEHVQKPIEVAQTLDERGDLTQSVKEQLRSHDHACSNCEVVFDD